MRYISASRLIDLRIAADQSISRSIRKEPDTPDRTPDRAGSLRIKESLGFDLQAKASCARAEVVLITTTQPNRTIIGFDFEFAQRVLSRLSTSSIIPALKSAGWKTVARAILGYAALWFLAGIAIGIVKTLSEMGVL